MRIVRTVFYVVGALIGSVVVLYFALLLFGFYTMGAFQTGRTSLPGPRRVAVGSTYDVTPECPISPIAVLGFAPGSLFTKIRSRSFGTDQVSDYAVGQQIICNNYPQKSIVAIVSGLDESGVSFRFTWAAL